MAVKGIRKFAATAMVLGALAVSVPASASQIVFAGSNNAGYPGNSRTFTDGSVNVRVTGWSVDTGGTIRAGSLGRWDYGLGVSNTGGDNSHTIDNSGWLDFILLQFDQDVSLENGTFYTGWHDMYDTDATIGFADLATPYTADLGLNNASLAALGAFDFYESGSVGKSGNNTRNINPIGNIGNTWILAASAANPDRYADGFKLKKLTFSVPPPPPAVPEPGTWALLILGFGLVGATMRRKDGAKQNAIA